MGGACVSVGRRAVVGPTWEIPTRDMGKVVSPLLGFNNNCRHKKRLFHVQTEDSGVKHPHVITHLFADGGRIVKSVKTGYAQHLESENMVDIVREMMKSQHKAMIVALYSGEYDPLLELATTGTVKVVEAPKPTPLASPSMLPPAPAGTAPRHPSVPPAEGTPAATFGSISHRDIPQMRVAVAEKRSPTRSMPNPLAPEGIAFTPPMPDVALKHEAGPDEIAPDTRRASVMTIGAQEIPVPPKSEGESIDMGALERSAAESESRSQMLTRRSDLPPPPPNMFREKATTGEYKAFSPPASEDTRPPASKRGRSIPPPSPTGIISSSSGRIPAATVDRTRSGSQAAVGSLPPDDKSLDDVILDFLRDDVDRPRRK